MSYVLILAIGMYAPMQIQGFNNLHGCQQALSQIQTLQKGTRGVCVDLSAKPHHWNGKDIKK